MKGILVKSKLLLLIIFSTALINSLKAEDSQIFSEGIIKGTVIDSAEGNPLPFANISLYKQQDSSFLGGTSSGTNGEFILSNVVEGNYFIKLSFMGYANKFIAGLNISANDKEYNLGAISLIKNTIQLQETQVMGEKADEELHLDKKVINVSQNLNAQSGTALDVLQNQPSVRVDPDGTVYLRGSSNFTILVNGKPSVLQGSDALRQIAATQIENIELITNPSARYDAEGSAGIININLKIQKDQSISGILNLNSGNGDKYNGDFTFNYNVNGLNLTSGLDYRDNTFTNNQDIYRTTLLADSKLLNTSGIDIRQKRKQYSFRGGLDYTIDKQNSLGLSFGIGAIDILGNLNSRILNQTESEFAYSLTKNKSELPVKYFNSTFTYQLKVNPDISDLNFEATYNYVTLPNEQLTVENLSDEFFSPANVINSGTMFSNDTKRNEGRAKLNYKHKLFDNTNFETGLQTNYSYRSFDLVYKTYDKNLMDYNLDTKLTNYFNLRNNVYAGFISINSELAGFDYMLGLRGEYTDRLLNQKTLTETFAFNKMDYFPSLSISRKIDDHQIQFSYSRRINRPNENMLNPFPFYSDANINVSGNPKLKPEYINAFELNYQKMYGNVFVSAQTYYRKSMDSFSQTFSVDTTGRLNVLFDNYGNSDVYGAELSTSFSLGGIFKFDPSMNLFQTNLNGLSDGRQIEKDFFNWSGRLNTTITFSPDTRMQISGNYMKFVDTQTESKPFMMISASLRHEFFNKTMSLTLQARNLFKASDIKLNTSGSNFTAHALVKPESPIFTLMFSYNFNNFKRSAKQTDNIDVQTGI